jgi:pyruvate formate lyase activating enzyme
VTPPAKDQVEAKPFYHFVPGALVTTVGGLGCTMACPYCYNWPLIHYHPRSSFLPIETLRDTALSHGSRAVVFAYNEPFVGAEFLLDASPVLHKAGLFVAATTNGFVNRQAREDLLGALDAVLVDIKDTRNEFYYHVLQGDLEAVWSTVAEAHKRIHVEAKWVVLPTGPPVDTAGKIAERLARIDPHIPLHIGRYYPHYQWTAPPTELTVLRACWEEARRRVHYVYAPELGDPAAQNTTCPICGEVAISRQGKRVRMVGLRDDHKCRTCGLTIPMQAEPRVSLPNAVREEEHERVPGDEPELP